jgi:endonuclease/exonuclease/phosphatase (EEP) superfamily protein YafD
MLAALGAVVLCTAAGVVAALSLAGRRGRWPDAFNSFAPLQAAAAAVGSALAWLAFGPGLPRTILIATALAAMLAALARVAPEYARFRFTVRRRGPRVSELRVLTANVRRSNPTPEGAVAAILACDADAVFLQEVGATFARELSRLSAMHSGTNSIGWIKSL